MFRPLTRSTAALLLAWACDGRVYAVEPDTFSKVVSFQYESSLAESGTTIQSKVVSFQYFDTLGDANVTYATSPSASFFYSGGGSLNVVGTVRTAAGVPIAGAAISAKRYSGVFWSGTSDGNGAFSVPGLTPTNYMLVVTKAGYVTRLSSHDGTSGGNQTVSVTMAALPAVPTTQDTTRTVSASAIGTVTTANQNSTTAARLWVLDANGQWTTALSALDASKPTIVITHGWLWLLFYPNANKPLPNEDWTKVLGVNLKAQLGQNAAVNVVVWDWHTDAATYLIPPSDKATSQGQMLGSVLMQSPLGSNYAQHIHFIGHSLGALVNRYACDFLHLAGRWSSAATRPHVTLLDEAELASIFQTQVLVSSAVAGAGTLTLATVNSGSKVISVANAAAALVSAQVKQDWKYPIPAVAHWVDNYISAVGFERAEAVNVCLPGSANSSLNPGAAHSYAHVWYERSALVAANSQAPPVGWRLSAEYAGAAAFPPIGTGLTKGSVWQENLNTTNELLDLTLMSNSPTGGSTNAILGNFVLGVGLRTGNAVVGAEQSFLNGYAASIEFVGQKTGNAIYTTGQVITTAKQKVGLFIDAALDAATDLVNTIEPTSQLAVTQGGFALHLSATAPNAPLAAGERFAPGQAAAPPLPAIPAAWMTVDVPPNAGMLAFDFTVTGEPAEDQVVCAVNEQNLFTLPAKFATPGAAASTDMMDISAHAGQTVELFFGLVGGTSTNCTVEIHGIRFITIPQPKVGIADLGGTFGVKWPAAATGWVLESSDTLAAGSWQTVVMPNGTTLADGVETLEVSKTGQRRFYRLRRLP